ncbi:HAD family phosphatase [Afipia sp. GAS231]|uniref:HAD family hydrolase n=1 Tax=Afipia sp. GAS231 TaxID=1882747 RepID=UPI000879CCBB|nr:HAD-IA family hydrolase [Afipia sp. GAS231]SDO46322.1 phosphoglycolate phosphatase [Afipia sp. GAS231]
MTGPGRALLFDIDGTLADTDALHVEAFNQIFAPRGHAFDRARAAKELTGFSNASIGARFLADEPPERQAAIMSEKEEAFRKLASGKIRPLAGLMTLLDRADHAGIPMVAVTNAPRLNAEMMLSGLGIMHRFKAVVIGDELAHGKPHPMAYREGLRAVNAAPNLSLAFEDSRSGIQSATAAGIATIGMRTSLGHDDLFGAGAVMTAGNFEDAELLRLVDATMKW